MKNYIYIGLIILALIIGYISHPSNNGEKISALEKDVVEKQRSINKLQVAYDSLGKIVVANSHRIKVDSVAHFSYVSESNAQILNLKRKISSYDFKSYSNAQLDSVIAQLYGSPK